MRRLAPNFFDRRFDDLIEDGRSRLPSLAPRWTDYNAHDPGITLMELLAWVGEAQLYSLGRMRRDERAAYAALLGLRPEGPNPASGSLWPDRNDVDSPFRTFRHSIVLEPDALVRTTASDQPEFHPSQRILWTPGRVASLVTRLADGRTIDQTRTNEHGDRAFEPFGALAGPNDRLRLEFTTNGNEGLFPQRRELAADALWALGVRVDAPLTRARGSGPAAALLRAVMRIGPERIELPVVEDGTRGFMQNGALLLDVSKVPKSPTTFSLEISAMRGFARPPRILRIEPGVIPIVQGGTIEREPYAGTGQAAQRIRLAKPGLRFGPGVAPVKVEVREDGIARTWRRVDDLAQSGPNDRDYELDPVTQTLTFGNGVNGYMPPFEAPIRVDYPYCDGTSANTPRNQRWQIRGIAGTFGLNPDAIDGGIDAQRDADLRREARRRLHEAHALVTATDIESAAREIAELEVARSKVPAIQPQTDAQREIVLIALRARASRDEPADPPETPRWLAAVRRALLARVPLGTRLRVRAPRYRSFSVQARIEAMPRRNPDDVKKAVQDKLCDAFTLVPRASLKPREFGASVTARDLAALIRAVPGVQRISQLALLIDGKGMPDLLLGRADLPRLDLLASSIDVQRGSSGGAR